MWEIASTIGRDSWQSLGVTQLIIPEARYLEFSVPQFLISVVAGVLMALAFQLLLTNFSVAFGISNFEIDLDGDDSPTETGSTIRKIETKVGIWALLSASLTLFAASFLAVKLSLIGSTWLGVITGVVIWSIYFLLLAWMGSTAIGALVGSLVKTATSGFQGAIGAATTALGINTVKSQAVSTAEAVTAAVRRELTAGIDPNAIRGTLETSLKSLPLPKLDLGEIQEQFTKILKDADLKSLVGSEGFANINRQTFVDLIRERTNLSKKDTEQLVDRLEQAWQGAIGQTQTDEPQKELQKFLKSATPEELRSGRVGDMVAQIVKEQPLTTKSGNDLVKQAADAGVKSLVTTVADRLDLSDLDVQKISQQLQKLWDKTAEPVSSLTGQVGEKPPALQSSSIRTDVDNYLLNSYRWHFNRETLMREFKAALYDPEAEPGQVRSELEKLDRNYLTQKLNQRGDLSSEQINEIASQLEEIRTEVFNTVRSAEIQARSLGLQQQIERYLLSTSKEELNPESIQRDFLNLLADREADSDTLWESLSLFDRQTLRQILQQRQDLSSEEIDNIVRQLESTLEQSLDRVREWQEEAKSQAAELREKVANYLRQTNKEELNPEGIERDFQTLLEDPPAGLKALRDRISQFDRDTLVQLLSQRQDLSEEEVNHTIDRLEAVRDRVWQAPGQLAGQAKEQYDKTLSAIAHYLKNTNLEELDPEGMGRDLQNLLEDPQAGVSAWRDRLAHVDRETLVKLLSQREDLSEEQVNLAIDRVEAAIGSIIKAPRRLATRARDRVQDFATTIGDYLRHTNKEELDPEGIKRDLQLLFQDPRAGTENFKERLSQFDRSTLVALLAQREDISEEEANRIVGQIESVRNSLVEQIQQVQQRVQSTVDRTFDRLRDYLNSLERPELNYEGIQGDFRQLFDDPQAGFDVLKGRLSQVNRDTLVALLSSREDISAADAERIVDRIESARDSVLQRAEQIQLETQKRLSALKEQAQKRAAETKAVVAGAAWWLFGTALFSLVTSAIAGALATVRIAVFP
ncbi:MAG: MFS transporter [Cyanosarcina radialis HA8281-LM2]|jgi:nucleoid DNA-binding protein/tRNA splicing endonuclease|nr:MFS transporter [Cyanosarcina radialis HA8281-LM2]